MRFRHYDNLRVFNVVARHGSFAAAAEELSLTKGAVSYQIKGLEQALGFALFQRQPRGVLLTAKGQDLWHTSQAAFESVERRIDALRHAEARTVTVGMSTYFASRWLSPRLMEFTRSHPHVRLRLQPTLNLFDLADEGVDLAIRWGRGDWTDVAIEPLFPCPAFATGAPAAAVRIDEVGLAEAFAGFTLLRDRADSAAWSDWHAVAGLEYHGQADSLIVPDPNVRVQAVIDGQGVALHDQLVERELADGRLVRLSPIQLDDYGYHLAYPAGVLDNPDVAAFAEWLLGVGRSDMRGVVSRPGSP